MNVHGKIPEYQRFKERLLIENNRPLYQGVREISLFLSSTDGANSATSDDVDRESRIKNYMKSYQMQNLSSYLSFDCPASDSSEENGIKQLDQLSNLYRLLDEEKGDVQWRYNTMRNIIMEIARLETNQEVTEVYIFGEQTITKNEYLPLPPYYAISPQDIDIDLVAEQACVEDEMVGEMLSLDGYYIVQNGVNYSVLIKLDSNYSALTKLFENKAIIKPEKALQKIEPIYIYIDCRARTRLSALLLVRKILMFRCKLITWLETDFNNKAIAELSMQRHWASILSTDKVGDHQDSGLLIEEEKMLTAENSFSFIDKQWNWSVDYNGSECETYEDGPLDASDEGHNDLERARKWYLLNGYINARIARLYRTMVRVEGLNENFDMHKHYGNRLQSIWQRPARQLDTVFFSPLFPGHNRRELLRTFLGLICFTDENIPDGPIVDIVYDSLKDEETRLTNIQQCFQNFTLVQRCFEGVEYTLLSEYLVVILFDCFLSALKASSLWSRVDWKANLFRIIDTKQGDRFSIQMYRECMEEDLDCDYLVIRNKVEEKDPYPKGKGMSQTAMKWYIEKFWESINTPKKVIAQFEDDSKTHYIVKMPILAKGRANK